MKKHSHILIITLVLLLPLIYIIVHFVTSYQNIREEAYADGYLDGINQAKSRIAVDFHNDFYGLANFGYLDSGMSVEKAVGILNQYKSGKSTSIVQIERAIGVISDFYNDLEELVDKIQDYSIQPLKKPQATIHFNMSETVKIIILISLYTVAFVGGIFLYRRCGRPLATTNKCLIPAAVACHECLDFPELTKSFESATKKLRTTVSITFSLVFLLLGIIGFLSLSLGYFVCYLFYRRRISFENDMMVKSTLSMLLSFVLPDMEDELAEVYADFVFAQRTGLNWNVSKWKSRSE